MEIVAEQWRSLSGPYGGWPYRISNTGKVVSQKSGSVLASRIDHKGYRQINLRNDGKRANTKVHRLVAMAFVPGYQQGLQVNHKNGNKLDNRPENLEWVTGRRNNEHAVEIGLRERIGIGHFRRKLTLSQANAIRQLLDRGVTQSFLARWFGVTSPAISCIRRGITYLS
jgi:hypothetical protein